jgi:hypothetical protein
MPILISLYFRHMGSILLAAAIVSFGLAKPAAADIITIWNFTAHFVDADDNTVFPPVPVMPPVPVISGTITISFVPSDTEYHVAFNPVIHVETPDFPSADNGRYAIQDTDGHQFIQGILWFSNTFAPGSVTTLPPGTFEALINSFTSDANTVGSVSYWSDDGVKFTDDDVNFVVPEPRTTFIFSIALVVTCLMRGSHGIRTSRP